MAEAVKRVRRSPEERAALIDEKIKDIQHQTRRLLPHVSRQIARQAIFHINNGESYRRETLGDYGHEEGRRVDG